MAIKPVYESILSRKNPRIQRIKKLLTSSQYRQSEQVFILEGVRLVEEAVKSGWAIQELFISEKLSQRGKRLIETLSQQAVPLYQMSDMVMEVIKDTETSQGILAVLAAHQLSLPENPELILILDAISDPGNVGTILRTSNAAGVDAVIVAPETADPFSPKALRAGMGAQLNLPVTMMDWSRIATLVRSYPGMRLLLADTQGGPIYWNTELRVPVALIISNEANGPSQTARQISDDVLIIPMPGKSESLNAAIAASLLIYEVLRQRWQKNG